MTELWQMVSSYATAFSAMQAATFDHDKYSDATRTAIQKEVGNRELALRAALSALPAGGGWKLVPTYPTKEMIEAGAVHTLRVADVDPDDESAMKDARNTSRGCVMAAYMDMVEVAPAAPQQQENPK